MRGRSFIELYCFCIIATALGILYTNLGHFFLFATFRAWGWVHIGNLCTMALKSPSAVDLYSDCIKEYFFAAIYDFHMQLLTVVHITNDTL